jgi:hypothetical protein
MLFRFSYLIVLFLTFICSLSGSKPQFWRTTNQSDFLKGQFKGVALTSDGRLILAPKFSLLFNTEQPFIYSLVSDKDQNIYLGTGGSGKIFRVPPSGSGIEIADLEESGVQSLAISAGGDLFAATAPSGSIYRIRRGKAPELFLRLEDNYIWDLTIDSDGYLYIATGPQGKIYRADTESGQATVFYDSKEHHFVDLGWDIDSNLLAGSAPGGHLLRLDKQGKPFILYDSHLEEIRGIQVDRNGNIYAAGISFELSGNNTTTASMATTADARKAPDNTVFTSAPSQLRKLEGLFRGKKSELYRIDREGLVTTLYGRDDYGILDLLVRNNGEIVIGTSQQGRLFSITPQRLVKLIGSTPDEQITRLLSSGETILLATSNLGKLYRLSSSSKNSGIYESLPLDAGMSAKWGRIRWEVVNPLGNAIRFSTRSGNTSSPDQSWSDWKEVNGSSEGALIDSPQARFLQWQIHFQASSKSSNLLAEGDAIGLVEISYLQQNLPPLIKSVVVHSSGAAFVPQSPTNHAGGGSIGGPGNAYLRSLPKRIQKINTIPVIPPRRIFVPGARSVSWEAADPNGDDLVYAVDLKRLNGSNWTRVATAIEDNFYTLDGVSIPADQYVFRITASDLISNPPELARQTAMQSKSFSITNSPPGLKILQTGTTDRMVTVSVTAKTTSSRIYQMEYSVDGGTWTIVYPVDGIADSTEEAYQFSIKDLSIGKHDLRVRVVDTVGNVGTNQSELNLP